MVLDKICLQGRVSTLIGYIPPSLNRWPTETMAKRVSLLRDTTCPQGWYDERQGKSKWYYQGLEYIFSGWDKDTGVMTFARKEHDA